MKHDHPPAAMDAVAHGTATGLTPIKSAEFCAACNRFLRSRGVPVGREAQKQQFEIGRRKGRHTKLNPESAS